MGKISHIVVFLFSFVLLGLSYQYNFMQAGYPKQFENFQLDSDSLVVNRINATQQWGLAYAGGFMLLDIKANQPDNLVYISQLGLQGILLGLAAPHSDAGLDAYTKLSKTLFVVLLAALLSVLVTYIRYEFDFFTALALLLGLVGSDWIIFFAHSLYWAAFLLFLPFVAAWVSYKRFERAGQLTKFYLLISFLVFIKALCGYEFITNVIASACIPVFYYAVLHQEKIYGIARRVLLTGLYGIGGFFAAMALHIVQLAAWKGSLAEAVGFILTRAGERTYHQVEDPFIADSALPEIINNYLVQKSFSFYKITSLPIVAHFFELKVFLLGGILLAIVIILIKHYLHTIVVAQRLYALAWALLLSVVAAFSWAILAKGHMFVHHHINHIIFYLPYILIFYILVGNVWGALYKKVFIGENKN